MHRLPGLGNILTLSGISEKEGGGFNLRKAGTGGGISYVAAQDAFQFKLQVPATQKALRRVNTLECMQLLSSPMTGGPTTLRSDNTDDLISDDTVVLNSLVSNAADRTIGDGQYIRIDNRKPTADAVSVPAVTINGKPIDGDKVPAVVGDEIRVAVKVATSGTVFRNERGDSAKNYFGDY